MKMTTKKEFEKYFRNTMLPAIKAYERSYGVSIDTPLRREEWNAHIDMLVQGHELPKKALEWDCPW